MKITYIKSDYRIVHLEDLSVQVDRLIDGEWKLFSFQQADDCRSESEAFNHLSK